jgi:glycosyltransferase involved in cell wall biosynthesis
MLEATAAITFAVTGALSQRTGGYGYDRRIIAELRAANRPVYVRELKGRFPICDDLAKNSATEAVSAVPEGSVLVIDGLALPAFVSAFEAESSCVKTIALIHHPLAMETGLSLSDADHLSEIEHALLYKVNGIVVTSPATARNLVKRGVAPNRVTVVCPGTDPAQLAKGSMRGPLQLLCVGSLIPRKGHLALIEALAGCVHLLWHLCCVGSLCRDQETTTKVMALLQRLELTDRVTLAGEMDDAALEAAYAAADIFVLASELEGFGMAFAEALARGLPIVGSGAGAVRETVPETAGKIVPVGDAVVLREALIRVIEDSNYRRQLAEGSRAAGRVLPDWPSAGRAFAHAIDAVAAL